MCGSPVPTSPPSPRVRLSLLSKFTVFNRRKEELEDNLRALEGRNNIGVQPDSIKVQCLDLKASLVGLKISKWVNCDDYVEECPDIDKKN